MTRKTIQPFQDEHAELLEQIDEIRALATDIPGLSLPERSARVRQTLEFLEKRLALHALAEEQILYPEIAKVLRHPHSTAPMVFDHVLFRERASVLADADPSDTARLQEALYGLYALLDSHFRKEEAFYLPLIEDDEPLARDIAERMQAVEKGRVESTAPLVQADEILARAVAHAILAPSSHNSQPWRFRVAGQTLELHADRSRALPVVDPEDRELVMSCGAALFFLRAALVHLGFPPEVELLPDPEEDDLLARVRLGTPKDPGQEDNHLFWAIKDRRTNRRRFADRPVPDVLLRALAEAAHLEGAWLSVVEGEQHRRALADLVAEADVVQAADRAFRRELAHWIRANSAHDGIPARALGRNSLATSVGPLMIRTFDWGKGQAARDRQLAEGSPVLVVLGTESDSTREWLAAGQALARVLLRATWEDVSASFLNQPVEVPAVRPRVAEVAGRPGLAQIVLRLGYGPPAPATPRRPLADVLTRC